LADIPSGRFTPENESIMRHAWWIFIVLSLLPAGVYLLVSALALVLGVPGPAQWVAEILLTGSGAIPMLWLTVIGGPVLGMVAAMILQLSSGHNARTTNWIGMIAWMLLIACVITCVPLPWLLFLAGD
jgi:hypothetical protein